VLGAREGGKKYEPRSLGFKGGHYQKEKLGRLTVKNSSDMKYKRLENLQAKRRTPVEKLS